MLDFETAREHLLTWYRSGGRDGERAFQSYFTGWLRPAVFRVAQQNGLSEAERDELLQAVAIRFAERERQVGAVAESAAYWFKLIRWRLQDLRRAETRARRGPKVDASSTEAGRTKTQPESENLTAHPRTPPVLELEDHPDPAASPEAEFGNLEEIEYRRRLLHGFISALSPVERLAHVCYSWPDLAAFVAPSIFDELSARCGLTPAEVRATLDAAVEVKYDPAEWARRTVVVFVSPGALSTPEARATALDTYRKARAHAAARFAELSAAETARKGGV